MALKFISLSTVQFGVGNAETRGNGSLLHGHSGTGVDDSPVLLNIWLPRLP